MNVLIVDDHPLVCNAIRNILLSEKSINKIVLAHDIQSALDMMGKESFNLAMVDVKLKNEYGIDFVNAAKENFPSCKYVIFSASSSTADFNRALEANVDGYILKDSYPEDILYAVNSVLRGKKYFDPVFFEKVRSPGGQTPEENKNSLSPREQEILRCLGEGMSNRSIASTLYISENTVKKHVSQILAKLGLNDRTQAALYATKLQD